MIEETDFKYVENKIFFMLTKEIFEGLSTDQYYSYWTCWSVILGHADFTVT